MGSYCGTTTSKPNNEHNCMTTCLHKKQLQCLWHPSEPFQWEYTDEHKICLQSALDKDNELQSIGKDIMDIIESYIQDIVATVKQEPIYYKHIRSSIYHQNMINKSSLKICPKFFEKYKLLQTNIYNGRELKVILLGRGGVGKTCLCRRAVTANFYDDYDPGIEDSYRKRLDISTSEERQVFWMDILDTQGQEEFISMQDYEIEKADVFWLCFDIFRASTFDYLLERLQRILRIRENELGTFSVIFVACKNDLKFEAGFSGYGWSKDEPIDSVNAMKRIEEIGDFPYIETSAKKGTNVEYLMEFTMHEMWLQTQTNVIDWNDVSNDSANERFMSKNVKH